MDTPTTQPEKLPPAWFRHLFWKVHRVLYRLARGRVLWTPKSKRGWGAMYLTTIGRKSGRQRGVIVGYIEDDSTPVVLAMNGWDEGHPAWWLNLEAHPDAVIHVKGEPERPVRARKVEGDECDRLRTTRRGTLRDHLTLCLGIWLGDELDFYRILDERGAMSAHWLAARHGSSIAWLSVRCDPSAPSGDVDLGGVGQHVEDRGVLRTGSEQRVLLFVVAVGVDVEFDVDVTEPLANIGVDAQDTPDVDVGAHGRGDLVQLNVAGSCAGCDPGRDAGCERVEHVLLGRRAVAVTQRGVVGREGELLHVFMVAAHAVPLVDRGSTRRPLDPVVPRREPELREFAVLAGLGDRCEHLVARHTVDFLGHDDQPPRS